MQSVLFYTRVKMNFNLQLENSLQAKTIPEGNGSVGRTGVLGGRSKATSRKGSKVTENTWSDEVCVGSLQARERSALFN